MYKFFEDFDNYLEKFPLALRIVPLPEFTINRIPPKKIEQNYRRKAISNIFLFLFVPRWYKISRNEKNLLSPFSRVVRYENNDDMYDNPATEAVIDFRWQKARNFFIFLFVRFIIFASCIVLVSWAYLGHGSFINVKFLFGVIIVFYYLAVYQLFTEAVQLSYCGPRKYLGDIFNIFDIISLVFSVIVMTMMFKKFNFPDGFGSVEATDTGTIARISFSIFLLWIEFVSFICN